MTPTSTAPLSTIVDVSAVDAGSELLGRHSARPLMLSPTGMSQLFHRDGELAVARAAAGAGVPDGLSTRATTDMAAIAAAAVRHCFQSLCSATGA